MCSIPVSRHSTTHATTVSGNTFKRFLPNRQRLHPWSREGGGGVLKVRPSPVRYVGSSSRRLTQGRVGEGSPLWQTLFLPRLTWKACRVEREGPGMYERNPDQPNPRLTYSACWAGGGRSVCKVFRVRSRHECGWYEKPRFSVAPCSSREQWVFGSLAPERCAGLKSTPGSTVLSLPGL